MYEQLAKEFILISNDIYKFQKNKIKLNLRGEASILIYLNKNDNELNITPGDLSNKLNIKTARVAALLNNLENKNLIRRRVNENDRRKIIIDLTIQGKQKAEELKNVHLNKTSLILEKFGINDAKEVIRLTKKLKTILESIDCED